MAYTKILTLFLFFLLTSTRGQFVCPEAEEVLPCTCEPSGSTGHFVCSGSQVTQDSIDNLFALTRSANNVSTGEGLNLSLFEMSNTELTSLNLTPFAKCLMEAFYLSQNNKIVQVIGGTNSTDEEEVAKFQFSSDWVSMDNSQLGDEAVGTLLKFVVPESVTIFSFVENQIQGSNGEILEGLDKFVNLVRLFLNGNQITKVGGGQFKSNSKLDALFLFSNQISELGEDAFLLNSNPDMANTTFEIWLDGNQLNNERIQPTHGLQDSGRPIALLAAGNQFDFISAGNFEGILTDSRSMLYLQNNQWICDDRMTWLKAGRDLYESRVIGMDCSNDPGFTVFTTSLINID